MAPVILSGLAGGDNGEEDPDLFVEVLERLFGGDLQGLGEGNRGDLVRKDGPQP